MKALVIGVMTVAACLAGCATGSATNDSKAAKESSRQSGVEKVCHQFNDPIGNPAYDNCVRQYERGGYVETTTGVRR